MTWCRVVDILSPWPVPTNSRCASSSGDRTCSRLWPGSTPTRRLSPVGWSTWCAGSTPADPTELLALDERRLAEPDWFQRPTALGYAAYADRFAGTLDGVGEHVDHLAGLGVTYLHLMPLLQPAAHPERRRVRRPGLPPGAAPTSAPSRTCASSPPRCASRGISLCLDLVLNHVAREHEWADGGPRRATPPSGSTSTSSPTGRSRTPTSAPCPRSSPTSPPATSPGTTTSTAWVWTTFNDYQWDLNWANPDVLCEFADIILTPGQPRRRGVPARRDRLPLEAARHRLPEPARGPRHHPGAAHGRRMAAPAVLFKAEAIVGPADLPAYLGVGRPRRQGERPRLPQQPDGADLVDAGLPRRPPSPPVPSSGSRSRRRRRPGSPTCAATTTSAGRSTTATRRRSGSPGTAHRRFLSDWYSGDFPGSWARGLVFQENPATGDRRISGSLASLAGLEAGDPDAVARILLAHAIILGFGGLPVIWMGDELGLLNDPDWADEPAHAADNRWVHRQRMPWPLPPDTHGIRPGSGAWSRAAAGCPTCTPPCPPRSGTRATRACCSSSAGTRPGRCWAPTTSPPTPAWCPREVLAWLGLDAATAVDHLAGGRPGRRRRRRRRSRRTRRPWVTAAAPPVD